LQIRKKIPGFCFESPWLRPLDLNLSSTTVTVDTRTLRATWSPELAQDVSAFHNIDAEAELTALLNQEINRQIGREIVNLYTQDLFGGQPLGEPNGNLFYFDFQYEETKEPKVYGDGSWSLGNTFDGVIGIKSEIKTHKLI
jgi:hypothetical protein